MLWSAFTSSHRSPASPGIMAHFGRTLGMPAAWVANILKTGNLSECLIFKVTWRRGRDSNPRNLAVHLISNQTQSTTLPPLLTRTVEEVPGWRAGKT